MKKVTIVLVSIIVSAFPVWHVWAEDVFPEFTTTTTTTYLPFRTFQGYHADPVHEVGLNVKYTLENSQLFTEPAKRHIQTLAEGFSGTTDRSTPWKTLTELVAAYQTGDLNKVRTLFTPESHGEIDTMLADPALKQKYSDFIQSIASVDVLLGFNYKNGFLAMLEVRGKGMSPQAKVAPTPLFFVKSGAEYLVSSVTLDEGVDSNITVFLQQNHPVADLLKPPLPEHILTVVKTGTGTGSINGDDIDCGNDCLEVYQEGMVVFLKAEPADDSVFAGWLVDGQPLQDRLEMTKDLSVTAIFNRQP